MVLCIQNCILFMRLERNWKVVWQKAAKTLSHKIAYEKNSNHFYKIKNLPKFCTCIWFQQRTNLFALKYNRIRDYLSNSQMSKPQTFAFPDHWSNGGAEWVSFSEGHLNLLRVHESSGNLGLMWVHLREMAIRISDGRKESNDFFSCFRVDSVPPTVSFSSIPT